MNIYFLVNTLFALLTMKILNDSILLKIISNIDVTRRLVKY